MEKKTREEINFIKKSGYYKYPKTVQLEITRECPFQCPQCYKTELSHKHMALKTIKKYLKEAMSHDIWLIVLNGGEPLLHPDFLEILRYIKELNCFNVNCFSSGYGLTDEIIKQICENKALNFYISLNGSNEKINSYSRQGYEYSLEAMKRLNENGCQYGVNWVARHDNVEDFPMLIDLCKQYGVSFLSVTSNKLIHSKSNINSQVTRKDIEFIAKTIKEESQLEITVESCFPQLTNQFKQLGPHDGCAAGFYNVNINVTGEFQPCTHLYYPEHFSSIQEYWNYSTVLNNLRKESRCSLCSLKCRYCKAMSLGGYNDFSKGLEECFWRV